MSTSATRDRPVTHDAPTGARGVRARTAALGEVALIVSAYFLYGAIRGLANDDLGAAVARASSLVRIEAVLRWNVEHGINQWFASSQLLGLVASYWYAVLHFTVTPAVLVWLYRRRPEHYRPVRTGFVVASVLAMIGYLVMPTAPPRLTQGFVDVLAQHGDSGWWGNQASTPRGLGGLTNELAAMPSLHVGWAVLVFWALWRAGVAPRWRVLAALYALGTTVVVIGTGNHWVLDAVAGIAVVVCGVLAAELLTARIRGSQPSGGELLVPENAA